MKHKNTTNPEIQLNYFFQFCECEPRSVFDKHFSLFCRVRIFTANVLVNDEQEKKISLSLWLLSRNMYIHFPCCYMWRYLRFLFPCLKLLQKTKLLYLKEYNSNNNNTILKAIINENLLSVDGKKCDANVKLK